MNTVKQNIHFIHIFEAYEFSLLYQRGCKNGLPYRVTPLLRLRAGFFYFGVAKPEMGSGESLAFLKRGGSCGGKKKLS